MNKIVKNMIEKYECKSLSDYENALKEIIQEIALLGLWRAKFFEVGAFYGGTSLRILYGLDRFSEDLDFSLLMPDKSFDISTYEKSLARELAAFEFEVSVEKKIKANDSSIESAFIKANTLVHLMKIQAPITTHKSQLLKIKLDDFQSLVIDPASVTVIDFDGSRSRLLAFNDTHSPIAPMTKMEKSTKLLLGGGARKSRATKR